MSTAVTVKGVGYTLAQDGDQDYGAYMTSLINAMINAINNTPLQTNVPQYDAVVSSVAARRTHATLEAVIADGAIAAGSNVLIDGDTFTQNTTLDISKKLYIYGLGDSTFEAGAGLGANPIIQFSVSGSRFQGIALDANGNNPTYAIQVDAAVLDICIDVEIIGAFATGDIDNQSVATALGGFIKSLGGNYTLPPVIVGDVSYEVQDFRAVDPVGTALQQQAGHVWDYTDLDSEFSAWDTLAYYRFANGALTTDDVGAFGLTQVGAPVNTNGIMGTAFAVDLDGAGDYYHVDGLLDTPSGLVNGFTISFWFKADDGHPALPMFLFEKLNVPANDYIAFVIRSYGAMEYRRLAGGVTKVLTANTILPNGATDWYFITIAESPVGTFFFVNGVLEASLPPGAPLGDDVGAGGDFFIGADSAGANKFAGLIAQFIVADAITSQLEVNFMASTLIAEPVAIRGTEYLAVEKKHPLGETSYEYQDILPVVTKYNNNIYRQGFVYDPLDEIKIVAKRGG